MRVRQDQLGHLGPGGEAEIAVMAEPDEVPGEVALARDPRPGLVGPDRAEPPVGRHPDDLDRRDHPVSARHALPGAVGEDRRGEAAERVMVQDGGRVRDHGASPSFVGRMGGRGPDHPGPGRAQKAWFPAS